jgi:hypothetical protein
MSVMDSVERVERDQALALISEAREARRKGVAEAFQTFALSISFDRGWGRNFRFAINPFRWRLWCDHKFGVYSLGPFEVWGWGR